jgi:hypothetical protein
MIHEKVVKRDDGFSIKIYVQVHFSDGRLVYIHYFSTKKKGQRRFRGINEDGGMFPKHYPTNEEIHQAKLELWEKLKP